MDHNIEIPNARLELILASLAQGNVPKYMEKTDRWTLNLAGRKYITLVDLQGPTPEGRFVYEHLGQSTPTTVEFNQAQEPTTRGRNQFIKGSDGKPHIIRTLLPDGKTWRPTNLGKIWGKIKHAEVIVYIPALCCGTNSKGEEYEREEYVSRAWPDVHGLEAIVLDRHLSDAQKDDAIIKSVKTQLGIQPGEQTFLQDSTSGEKYLYDPTREHQWRISKMITQPSAAGPSVFTSLHTPLSGIISTHIIPFPNQVLDVCLEQHDDHLCVCRGIAAIKDVDMSVEAVVQSFDFLLGNKRWQNVGLTAIDVQRWCEDCRRPFYCILMNCKGRWEVKTSNHADPQGRSIAFCAYEGHCYMYKDAHLLARMIDEDGFEEPATQGTEFRLEVDAEPMIQADYEHEEKKTPEVKDWLEWDGNIRPGNFYANNLQLVRQEFLQKGRSPKVVYNRYTKNSNENVFSMLMYTCIEQLDETRGDCYIRHLDKNHEKIKRWLDCIHELTGVRVKWQGQGLPNLTLTVFKQLLKSERSVLSRSQKIAIRERQQHLCAQCKVAGIDEFDHIIARAATCRGKVQMFRGLCTSCHLVCTVYESDRVIIKSSLSPYACEAYKDTARAPNLQFVAKVEQQTKKSHLHCFDIKRCRLSALRHYDLPDFPVYCVVDNIEERVDTQVGDLNYINMRVTPNGNNDEHPCVLGELPLYGSGWYPKIVARHALSQNIIAWDDIKLTYSATGRIPRESVETVLDIMEQAWEGNQDIAKDAWNSCVGCMSTEFAFIERVVPSESDIPARGTKYSEFSYLNLKGEQMKVFDHITKIPTLSSSTYRPIWDCIMGWEHVKVSCLLMALDRMATIPRRCVLELQTDAVLVDRGSNKKRKLDEISGLSYEAVGQLSNSHVFKQCTYPVRVGDVGHIYHEKPGHEMPKRRFNKVRRTVTVQPMVKRWREIDTMVDGQFSRTPLYTHCMAGNSVWIAGPGGCGKTTYCQEICTLLRAAGKQVQVIAKTHSALMRFADAHMNTADKWLHWHVTRAKGKLPDVILIDEISLLGLNLWTAVATMYLTKKVQIILAGDLFQLDPPKNTWCGSPVVRHALKKSDLLFQLAGGNHCFFYQNLRSDETIFKFAMSLRDMQAVLSERLAAAKELFPPQLGSTDTALTLSHFKREMYNCEINLKKKPEDAIYLELPGIKTRDDCQPQAMWIWPGMTVIGHTKPCCNSQLYTVDSITDSKVVLNTIESAKANGEVPTSGQVFVNRIMAPNIFRMAFAMTYMKSQGITLKGRVALCDVHHEHFTIEHLNLGVTRATHSSLVEIRDDA